MTLQECYQALEGDYQAALKVLMMDRLVDKFLLKFPGDGTMAQLRQAVAENNIELAFRAAHTLKGVAGNLALTALGKAASDLTEQLRSLDKPADPALVQAVEDKYQLAIKIIEAYQASK